MGWGEMRRLAELLRGREQIPDGLADFIASAIEDAEKAEAIVEADNPMSADRKVKIFTDRLGLTSSKGGRPRTKLTWQQASVERDFRFFSSKGKALEHLASLEGGCSIGTARNRLNQADEESAKQLEELKEAVERGEITPD